MHSYSYEQQDEFIFTLFDYKTSGYFIDVACGHPILGNNTYALDKNFGWSGLCFEIGDVRFSQYVSGQNMETYNISWEKERKANLLLMDATSKGLTDYLRDHCPKTVDYISLDVDAAGVNLALDVLHRILDADVRFKAMTFEHEIYLNQRVQEPSRRLLESLGYKRLFGNVRLWGGGVHNDQGCFSEDWWIDPNFFEPELLSIADDGLYFFDCVDRLKEYKKITQHVQHHCCQAYISEVDMFATEGSHSYHSHAIRTPGWKSANQ